jgi:ribonuclease P protein component
MTASGSSGKNRTISSSDEIRSLIRNGNRIQAGPFRVAYQPKREHRARFAVVAGKRLGNAVARNRIKRRIREIMRRSSSFPTLSADVVIFPQRSVLKEEFKDLLLKIDALLSGISV